MNPFYFRYNNTLKTKRSISLNEEHLHKTQDQNKQKTPENSLKEEEEETSLFLSMVDINILQNIFIQLVDQHKWFHGEEIKEAFTLLLHFSLTCKLFSNISKQPLFPLILNNININLNHKKYLKILYIKQTFKKYSLYKEKNVNDLFSESCFRGYYDLIKTLINYGANINTKKTDDKWTPLISATFSGNIKTVKKLIKFKNLNINQQDLEENTALIMASYHGKEDIVSVLISRKDIDINIKDDENKTALDWAKEKYFENIVNILENYQQ